MHQLMTIQDFSRKTGIPKSTLRFYESKNLLKPIRNKTTNYRMYTEDQIPLAKLIASLRTANIPIRDIQHYLQSNEQTQQKMKQEWMQHLKDQKVQLEMGLRYLESDQGTSDIYLFERDAETVIWFHAEAPPGQFSQDLLERREQIRKYVIPVTNTYIRYESGTKAIVQVEIGFGIPSGIDIPFIKDASVEVLQESTCIGLSFTGDFLNIEAGYRKLFQYCMSNNWEPASSVLEWYRGDQIDVVDIIIPVTQGGRKS